MIQPTLTNLHPNTLKNLDRCVETCNALNGLCLCLKWNKRFESNQSKKHISCDLKCKVDAIQCDSNQKRNNDKCPREYKKIKLCLNKNCSNKKYFNEFLYFMDLLINCDCLFDNY